MKKIWHIIKQSALSMNNLAPPSSDELFAVRQRFLRYLLYISIFASFPAMLIATKEALAMGDRFSPAFYLGLFITVLCITVFQNRIGFAWKTIIFISAFFALAVHNLLWFGFSGAGIDILLIVCVLMTVLLGQLAGILTLMAGLAAIVGVGVAMSTGVTSVGLDLNYLSGQMISWMTAAGVFVLLAGAGVLIPGKLQDELGQSLEKSKTQSDQLSRANRELENEVARRKQAENELRLQALVLDQIQDRVTITDMEGSLSYINEAEKQALGYARTPLCQASVTLFGKKGDSDSTMLQILEKTRERGHWHGRIANRIPGGPEVFLDCRTQVVYGPQGDPLAMCIIATDITEEVRLENQLNQAQKMESVGRLAGGVAHDFNNKLSVINGYAELAMEAIDHSDPVHKTIQEIHTAGKQSADIVRQLLAFARKQTISPILLDLNDTISSMLKMLQRLIGENISLAWHPGNNLRPVKIDPSQVDQIMANLAVNARDSISDVGKLTIETDNIMVDKDYCRGNPEAIPGQYVMLAVSDNGHGIEKEVQERIFDPYFTTKEVGKGTGLGLPTIYGIVKQNKGFVNVYSEPGEGTTFKLYFPAHEETKPSLYSAEETTGQIPTGTETVLVVEDEKTILQMSKQMLERLGYTVEIAANPFEALKLSEEYVGTLHLLITDVVMPEMNGRDLSAQLVKSHPGLKTLYMSGYTANVIAHHGVLDDGVEIIQKPFSLRDLALKVREVLEQE
ncbi:MAG: response regulator [Desulfosalsimonas sp.]